MQRGGEASYRRMERRRESSLCGGISWRSGEDGDGGEEEQEEREEEGSAEALEAE